MFICKYQQLCGIGYSTGRPAHEGAHGEVLSPGTIYVAPGGKHMLIERNGQQARIVINDDPPVHFCRPSVDTLFSSAADVFGAGTLAVILTGMGVDGADGAALVAAAGGSAQRLISGQRTQRTRWSASSVASSDSVSG